MTNRRWIGLLLAGAALLSGPPLLRAQTIRMDRIEPSPRPSHRLLDDGPTDLNQAEEFLSGRLRNSRDLHDVQGILQKLLQNPDLAEKLLRNVPENYRDEVQKRAGSLNLDDPNLRRLLDNAIKMPSVSEEQKGRLEDLRKQLPSLEKPDKNALGPNTNPFDRSPFSPPATNPEVRPSDLNGPTPRVEKPDSITKKLAEAVDNLGGGDSHLGDTLQQMGSRLNLDKWAADVAASAARWSGRFPNLGRYLNFDRLASSGLGSFARRLRWPSFNLGGSMGGGSWVPSVPNVSGGFGQGIVYFLLIAVGGLLAWQALRRTKEGEEPLLGRGWRLGQWPVRPGEVATRLDLVRAFEHLALLRIGQAAESRNHLDLAARLGDDEERRAAADRLAGLYEQARYAPPEELLPEADLATARRDLLFLAGAASS
jgi:hypothetical protein